jgi:hypothetical protein
MLRLMMKRPEISETGLPRDEPTRAAGIMPGPAQGLGSEEGARSYGP